MFNTMLRLPYLSADNEIGGGSEDFSDVVLDNAPETTEEVETTEATETAEDTTEAVETKTEAKFRLKYNHEEKDYTEDETKTLAQKGKNLNKMNSIRIYELAKEINIPTGDIIKICQELGIEVWRKSRQCG